MNRLEAFEEYRVVTSQMVQLRCAFKDAMAPLSERSRELECVGRTLRAASCKSAEGEGE